MTRNPQTASVARQAHRLRWWRRRYNAENLSPGKAKKAIRRRSKSLREARKKRQ